MVVTKQVRSSTRYSALVGVLVLGLAACSEHPTQPAASAKPASSSGFAQPKALMSSADGSGTTGWGQDGGSRTFTVWPGDVVSLHFGDHSLKLPANVICDPETSGYGPDFWDQPCNVIDHPIDITATWSVVNGEPVISFSPDLRFVPSSDESRWVKLTLKDTKDIDLSKYYTVLWFNTATGAWVDEAANDVTLRAQPNQNGKSVTRRLKHFSDWELWSDFGSYNVTSGLGGAP